MTPRYRVPGREATSPTLTPRSQPRSSTRHSSGSSIARLGRSAASWTYGRGNRIFHNGKPWGLNAAGHRYYGDWRSPYACSPYGFAWGYVPAWCRWGYYSWPAYCGLYWPRYYGWSSSWTSYSTCYWGTYDPYCVSSFRPWYWPTSVYVPTAVYYTSGSYVDESFPTSHVTIRIGDDGDSSVSAAGDAVRYTTSAAPTKASKETLAERHVVLADAYFREGRYQDSVDSCLRALSYLPDDASIHFALADGLFALGDYHYAAFMIERGIELDPELATVIVDKRTFYGDAKAFTTQVDTLLRYTAEKPYDAAAFLVLGYNLRFSGDNEGAERAFKRVLEIDKHSNPAELFLEAIRSKAPARVEAK